MTTSNVNRRRFLTTIGLGGAAAAAAVVGQRGGGGKEQARKPGKEGKGYQLTEHVRKYYETAKV